MQKNIYHYYYQKIFIIQLFMDIIKVLQIHLHFIILNHINKLNDLHNLLLIMYLLYLNIKFLLIMFHKIQIIFMMDFLYPKIQFNHLQILILKYYLLKYYQKFHYYLFNLHQNINLFYFIFYISVKYTYPHFELNIILSSIDLILFIKLFENFYIFYT